jgi:DNA-binding NarL/FixJ family response regulator
MSKVRVLLADDTPQLWEVVARVLTPAFEIVGKVRDGQALFDSAMKLQPDIIISDISMPVLNGIEAANKLKVFGCRSKIVFLTVHSGHAFVRFGLDSGALGFVLKSRMTTELVLAIQEALAGRTFVSPPLPHESWE